MFTYMRETSIVYKVRHHILVFEPHTYIGTYYVEIYVKHNMMGFSYEAVF